jgi:hypothetical protein
LRFVRAALVAVVLSLALPGAAAAQSFSVPAHLPRPGFMGARGALANGPALGGDRALWWESRAGTAVLVSARAGEAPRDLLALPPVPARGIRFTDESVAANESIAIVQRVTTACRGSGGRCDGPERLVADQRLQVDLARGPPPRSTCASVRPRAGAAWRGTVAQSTTWSGPSSRRPTAAETAAECSTSPTARRRGSTGR